MVHGMHQIALTFATPGSPRPREGGEEAVRGAPERY